MSPILILNDFLIKNWSVDRRSSLSYGQRTSSFLNLRHEFLFFKNIAHSMDRHDIARLAGILLNFLPKVRDIHMDMFHASSVFISPNIHQDLFKRQQLTGIAGQINQQTKFHWGQLDPFALDENFMLLDVDTQVAVVKTKRGCAFATPILSIMPIGAVVSITAVPIGRMIAVGTVMAIGTLRAAQNGLGAGQ